jgi:hypothetical protein
MDIYIERGVGKIVVICIGALAIACIIGMVLSPSGPDSTPSVRTETLIFEGCLEKSKHSDDQRGVIRECRIAAAQMVGRLPRTQ